MSLTKARRPRGTRQQQGYGAQHQRWRAEVLRQHPTCQHCRVVPSNEADHIIPIREGGARFDPANGQGLCKPCHSRKTARENANGLPRKVLV